MSLQACAELLRKGDPDRFLAAMAAPVARRPALLAIWAFNLEVARAPWVSAEAAIGEIRLQWWVEALQEIAAGASVRRHEVATPLAEVLDAEGARLLMDLVDARRRDIYPGGFDSADALMSYLMRTAGTLMWVSARAIGCADAEPAIRAYGQACGLASWFLAVPQLRARGRLPLPDGRAEAIRALAGSGLALLRANRRAIPRAARPATRSGWRAGRILSSAAANPTAVTDGALHVSEFSRRASLLWRVLSGAP